MSSSPLEHAKKIALPSSVGRTIGREFWGVDWVLYKWLAYMEQRIVPAIRDRTRENYFIVNAPPQTGKTSYVGTLLPYWITGMLPDLRVMYIGYSDEFAVNRGKEVRGLHEKHPELFGRRIDPDFQSGGEWRIKGHFGGMLSVGIGGQITGMPGDVIIIDDLIKNDVEANSAATKASHLGEWDGTINRRKQPGSTVIVMATRWADDDLSGALIDRMNQPGYNGPRWEVLSFPAFAEPPEDMDGELTAEEKATWRDIIGREFGEVLDCRFSNIPGREPADYFLLEKAGMDPFKWACLYQQRPFAAEGSMFPKECWRRYKRKELPEMEELWRVWDCASTAGAGDWTVGTKMGRANDQLYVLDVQRFRKAADGVLQAVQDQAGIDGYYTAIGVEEEKGAAGKTTIAAIERLLPRHRVEPMKAEGDKKSRATPWSAEVRAGRAWLPEEGEVDWDVQAFIDEHARMMQDGRLPRHDDQIDTASYAAAQLIGGYATELWMPGSGEDGETFSPEALVRLLEQQSA